MAELTNKIAQDVQNKLAEAESRRSKERSQIVTKAAAEAVKVKEAQAKRDRALLEASTDIDSKLQVIERPYSKWIRFSPDIMQNLSQTHTQTHKHTHLLTLSHTLLVCRSN